jgi:hypothetical protein
MAKAFVLDRSAYHLSTEQIDTILDRLVPQLAAPEDHDFFRAVLRLKAEGMNSSAFAAFVAKVLKEAA